MVFEDLMLFFAFLVKVILLVFSLRMNQGAMPIELNDIWALIDYLFILVLVVENLVFG